MNEINWIHATIALAGGGAAGAIITIIVSAIKSRVQPVGKRIDLLPIFKQSGEASSLQANIAIQSNGVSCTFKNLFVAEIQVVNRGNSDIEIFEFGITLGEGDKCIHLEVDSADRHHRVIQETVVNPEEPQGEIDLKLKPFNRKDSYSVKMYIVIPEGEQNPKQIKLGSPSPTKFVEMPTVSEVIAEAARGMTITIGGMRIKIG